MDIIFLTMSNVQKISEDGIYNDLMRCFRDKGHNVTIVTPREPRLGKQKTMLKKEDGVQILGVRTLNLQKASIIEKGIGQLLVEYQFKRAIKRHLGNVKMDLILYTTPPITLMGVVKSLKKRNPQAKSYLLLKDIFPQNAVDIGIMRKEGVKGILYKFFRNKEKLLYRLSDYIGCMSPANVRYVLKENPEIPPERVEVAPNSYEIQEMVKLTDEQRVAIRQKYNLPIGCPILVYGGNLQAARDSFFDPVPRGQCKPARLPFPCCGKWYGIRQIGKLV